MPGNNNLLLSQARKYKNDEFYTRLVDIEDEVRHYKSHFEGKVVYCNCDDPATSNFAKYFINNFESLQLKKLIVSCYKTLAPDLFHEHELATYLEYEKSGDEDTIRYLVGDGDFRSRECSKFLDESDIVVTNPPFSLFREFISQLMEHNKKFLVIGHQNAVTYKDTFRFIQNNQMWLGYGFDNGVAHFVAPYYENYSTANVSKKEGLIRISGILWFTNLEHEKQVDWLPLTCKYDAKLYPKYDNYDAIEVSKTRDIPVDYDGKMGVPITFLMKHNPNQFEIIGLDKILLENDNNRSNSFTVNNQEVYCRIIIRHLQS